jgi:hypothetical protein
MYGHVYGPCLSSFVIGSRTQFVSEGPVEMLTACLLVGICMDPFVARKKAPHDDTPLLCDRVSGVTANPPKQMPGTWPGIFTLA